MSHADTLDRPERLAPSFYGSLAFHGLLAVAVVAIGWVERHNKVLLGDPSGGRMGAVAVTAVSTIPLPARTGAKNPVAVDTESHVPTPITKPAPKAAPKVKPPDPKAVPIPSRNPKELKPRAEAEPPNKFRAKQQDLPNQLYSNAGTRVSTPDYAVQGGGGVGVGSNSPFGDMFGGYADVLRNQVAKHWQTSDIRVATAPVVGVTFVLHRDGSVTAIRISQKSGISALDISAQRAVMDAAPFPSMPPGFPKNEAEIEFLFQLKR
jgi:protein TonB